MLFVHAQCMVLDHAQAQPVVKECFALCRRFHSRHPMHAQDQLCMPGYAICRNASALTLQQSLQTACDVRCVPILLTATHLPGLQSHAVLQTAFAAQTVQRNSAESEKQPTLLTLCCLSPEDLNLMCNAGCFVVSNQIQMSKAM